jgi:hypothetical protein
LDNNSGTLKRVAKKVGLPKNPNAYRLLISSIEDFKRTHRFSVFHKWTSTQQQLKSKMGIFKEMVEALEEFRADSLGMSENPFYHLVAEFIRTSNSRQYIPIQQIFSRGETSEGWIDRVQHTLSWICDLTNKYEVNLIERIAKFQSDINTLNSKFDSAAGFRSKDWYCLGAILQIGSKKGWSEETLLERLKKYYRNPNRRKKATPEMVLFDVLEGLLDTIEKQPKTKKQKVSEAVDGDAFYKDWSKKVDSATDFWLKQGEKPNE